MERHFGTNSDLILWMPERSASHPQRHHPMFVVTMMESHDCRSQRLLIVQRVICLVANSAHLSFLEEQEKGSEATAQIACPACRKTWV